MVLIVYLSAYRGGAASVTGTNSNVIEFRSIVVGDKYVNPGAGKMSVRLPASREHTMINFGFPTNATRNPVRLCFKLDGVDHEWKRGGGGVMFFRVQFYNEAGDIIDFKSYPVSGDSVGWRSDLKTSTLTHRREAIAVPPKAARVVVVISSGGPPSTEGVYVVSDLKVSQISPDDATTVLLQFPDSQNRERAVVNPVPNGWVRDGTSPSMAKIAEIGESPSTLALEIFDDNPAGHADWHNVIARAPRVNPGGHLVVEWNEMYSIGDSALHYAEYPRLPLGNRLFHVMEVDPMEVPTGVEATLLIRVPPPFYQTGWFWSVMACVLAAGLAMIWQYAVATSTRRAVLQLEKQRMLEQERLRIARDIHDDLGARVTQISLVSAMAHDDPKQMREGLEQISQMSRDLVTALYETVWTVNPENDNLHEMGHYVFQIVNDLCERGQCRCRFSNSDLPREIIVSSHVRHNLCMVVKEAMNNIIKHAKASEVKCGISFQNDLLTIFVQDDGCGFDAANVLDPGHGLTNMQKRIEELGGNCRIESQIGHGTTIRIYFKINAN